ncbi:MAG: DUF4358 domain-containing protein [Acutalibacteraceae bacterium]
MTLPGRKALTITALAVIVIAAVALSILAINLIDSSSPKQNIEAVITNPTTDKIAKSVLETSGYNRLKKLKQDNISKYYSIPEGLVLESTVYISKSTEKTDEIACFKLKNTSYYKELEEIITEHISSRLQGFNTKDNKYSNYVISQNKEFVFAAVGEDSALQSATFKSLVLESSD